MRPIARPRRSWPMMLVIASATFLVGGFLTVTVLAATGVVKLPWWANAIMPPSYEGMVPVPVSIRNLKSGEKVTRDDFVDLQKGNVRVVYLKPEKLRTTTLVQLEDIIGRVLARDKRADTAFSSEDFHPLGTRPGPTAAIPFSKRSLAIPADKLHGLVPGMKEGDRVDVVVTIVADPSKSG